MSYPENVTLSLHFEENLAFVDQTRYFAFHRELAIEEASPMRGFVGGDTTVTIQGTGFLDVSTLSCQFGSVKVLATFVSSNKIACSSPPASQALDVELTVSLNGVDFSNPEGKYFSYDKEVELFLAIPSNVPVSNSRNTENSYITVMGSSFINTTSLSCLYGKKQTALAHFVSESEVKCHLPQIRKVGESEVRISLNGVDYGRKKTVVSFIRPALISSISPQTIEEGSEVDILVKGESFLSSAHLRCYIGRQGHLWSPARWMNDSSLKCLIPPLNLTHDGVEYISVSNNGGHDTGRQLFSLGVSARAQFLSLHPVVGYIHGGTDVVITLGNVKHISGIEPMCHFGSEAVYGTILSASSVICKSPPYHAGDVLVKLVSNGEQILAAGAFEYIHPPLVQSLQPAMGPLGGGTVVSIIGSGFNGVTNCRFCFSNGFQMVTAIVENDSSLRCDTPFSGNEDNALVELTHNGEDFIEFGHVFRYRAGPRLLSLEPSFGSAMGGKTIYAIGENFFEASAMCRFGTSTVDAIYISPTLLSCISPELEIGPAPVSITFNGADFITNSTIAYESFMLPQIKSIEPALGTVMGNETVLLHTSALAPNHHRLSCQFGENTVSATFISSNSASCILPAADSPSIVNLSISVDGERYLADGTNTAEFTYVSEPKVKLVSPNHGWTAGGAGIVMSVNDFEPFHSYDLSCSFGGSKIFEAALRVSNHHVSCILPRFHEATMEQNSPILMKVSTGLNAYYIKTPVFTYVEPAIVTSINPPIGSIRGGSLIQVSGVNFSNMFGLQCLFGDDTVDAEFLNEREVQCVAPMWKGGPKRVDVHIRTKGGPQLTIASHATFEWLPNPTIQDIHPTLGSINGGTNVTISGIALTWPDRYLSCRFGNSTLVPAVSTVDGALVCTSPAWNEAALTLGGERAVTVSVYANHGQIWLASSDDPFVYADHIDISALSPNMGPVNGGTVVMVSAKGLHQLPIHETTCHFGNTVVSASYSEVEDYLKCVAPPIEGSSSAKSVMLNLDINGLRDTTSIGKIYTYYRAPSVISIFPSFGFLEGGEDVFISGKHFRKEEGLGCMFGDIFSPKTVWLSDSSIICTSPVTSQAGTRVSVRVTNNGMDYTDWNGATEYSSAHRPDASKVMPGIVQWEESTNITIVGKALALSSGCRFGGRNETYPAFNVTNNSAVCEVPPATSAPLSLLPSSSQSKIPIFLELENGIIATGLEIMYAKPPPKAPDKIKSPEITSIAPNHGSSIGGDWIHVYGEGFLNTNELACLFGDNLVHLVHFISSSEIRCRTPRHHPGRVSVGIINSGVGMGNRITGDELEIEVIDQAGFEKVEVRVEFTFVTDLSITFMSPTRGSMKGGTEISVFGSFPCALLDGIEHKIHCKFGMGGVVPGVLVSQNEVTCTSPASSMAEASEVRVSCDGGHNFATSSSWFFYEHESKIESLIPNYGYSIGRTPVVVVGSNFRNITGMECVFGNITVSASFLSTDRVTCTSPPRQMEMGDRVPFTIRYQGGTGSSWVFFEYIDQRPQLSSLSPLFGDSSFTGETDVTVNGWGFRPVLHLMCAFGKVNVQARVINDSALTCRIPRHPPGSVDFRIIDQYALFVAAPVEGSVSQFHFVPEASVYDINPTWNVTQAGLTVFARGTNFDTSDIACTFGKTMAHATVMAASLLSCSAPFYTDNDGIHVSIGLYGSIHSGRPETIRAVESPVASNGTTMGHNVTLCEPGTFQPQNAQRQCLPCPIGFMCPLFGQINPVICPVGAICDRLGLIVSTKEIYNLLLFIPFM